MFCTITTKRPQMRLSMQSFPKVKSKFVKNILVCRVRPMENKINGQNLFTHKRVESGIPLAP